MVKPRDQWKSLHEYRNGFEQSFVHGDRILAFLRASGVEITRIETDPIESGSWHVFIKPTAQLKEMFGCTRELLVFCSPFVDLQSRTVEAVEGRLRRDPLRLEGDIAVLVSADREAPAKVRNFITKTTIIPFSVTELAAARDDLHLLLRHRMGELLYMRNLYDETTPVDGARFFGRKREVDLCVNELRARKQLGIFGLRKIGKTSLVREVANKLESDSSRFSRVCYIDLQKYALYPSMDRLLFDIGRDLLGRTGTKYQKWLSAVVNFYSQGYLTQPKDSTTARFADDVSTVCNTFGSQKDSTLVLILDEIEYLVGTQVHAGFPNGISFMRMWRGLCQQYPCISTAIVGVNSTIIETPMFQGVENPLFKFFKSFYLPNLPPEETKDMVKTIGRKIGISWEYDCHDFLYENLGGHPFLTRQFCALVAEEHVKRPTTISRKDLEAIAPIFFRKHSSVFQQIFEILDQFYPEESTLMELVATGQCHDPVSLVSSPEAVQHLVGCGLLSFGENEPVIPIGFLKQWIVQQRHGG